MKAGEWTGTVTAGVQMAADIPHRCQFRVPVRNPAILGAIIIDHPSRPANMTKDHSSGFATQEVLLVAQRLRRCLWGPLGGILHRLTFFRSGKSR